MRAIPYFDQYDFKVWEKALIVLSVLLFVGSLYLYVTDYPLRRYLFNIDDEGHGHPIGAVSLKAGGLRRQFNGEAEFKAIELAEPLYDEDTVVTGSDSSATLKLEDGSSIDLAPNTMVRLHFSASLTLGGISRAASVDVVAGSVKPDHPDRVVIRRPARPIELPKIAMVVPPRPVPVPQPTVDPTLVKGVELIQPRQGTELALDRGTLVAEKHVSFTWSVSPSDRSVQLTLWKLSSRGPRATHTQVYQEVIADHAGMGTAEWTLDSPGYYQWELRGPKGEPIRSAKKTYADFVLLPDFEAVEPLEPLVGGELLATSKFNGRLRKNFDITLRWKPYPGASRYRIRVKTQPNAPKPILDKMVRGSEFLFNKDRVYTGQIYYDVSAPLKNGFIAHSQVKPFIFTFLAPALATPPNHAQVTRQEIEDAGDSILITWQKTNFTEWYEIQIAKDAQFKAIVATEKMTENFYIFKSPPVGKYYWRLRSSSRSVVSPFSGPADLSVVP